MIAISPYCINVGPSGECSITWSNIGTMIANFRAWHINYSSNVAGPFSTIDSVTVFANTMYVDLSANAAIVPAYYFISFKSNDGTPDIISDTIRAVGLNVNNPGNGLANLSWNPMHIPLIATNNPYYFVYREYPAGIFTLIDSVDARVSPIPMTYNDVISICSDTVKYVIQVRDSSGCISQSSIKGDLFNDLNVPAIPILDSVSVDLMGNTIITWLINASMDTRSYVILQNPGLVPIDTVIGLNSTILNTTISAQNSSVSFEIIAIDSCNNQSTPSSFHSTIFQQASFDYCTQAATLSWTPYNFWGALPMYNIFVRINGGAEMLIASTTQTNFIDTNLISGSVFCYRVQAAETAGIRTSTSNSVCIAPNFPPAPAFSYLRKVTVIGKDQIYIEAFVDSGPTVKGYELQRSTNQNGPYSVVEMLYTTGVSTISFTDNISTDSGPYYYNDLHPPAIVNNHSSLLYL